MTKRSPAVDEEGPARERIRSFADPGSVELLPAAGASPHLARFGIAARDDDGIVGARVHVAGLPMLVAAQDASFLGGSVGARHAQALQSLFGLARAESAAAVVLLLASGGVRLHEANAAELGLARALTALLDARAAGVPVLAIAVGHVFGGASVLACAADRLAVLPQVRIGLSGPRVLESVHGKWELDADDERDVDLVFGALSRTRAGYTELVKDEPEALRAWAARAAGRREPFDAQVFAAHTWLAARVAADVAQTPAFEALPCFDGAAPVDPAGRLWRHPRCWLTAPSSGVTVGPAEAHALDSALLLHVAGAGAAASAPLVLVEDSAGHAVSRAAEMRFVSQYLAHHAAVLALLRHRGRRLVGLLAGTCHSAAFFSHALQADERYALPQATVVAMEPTAIARVTGLDAAPLIENDPMLGHPVRHFAAQGGVVATIDEASLSALGI
ncbi:MAG TPA: biotin-independent malonate decarboxylase subunit gamma [Casimicrobiaceae bacterium]|nr:biotin-independent malonate decarboxylase subunit gamma [Casimicrobiaceae bacterium]